MGRLTGIPKALQAEFERVRTELSGYPSLAPQYAKTAAKIWLESPFAASLCQRDPGILTELIDSGDLERRVSADSIARRVELAVQQADSEETVMRALRKVRQREMLRIAWRDLAGNASLNETLTDLSIFAEVSIRHALDWCHRENQAKFGVPRTLSGDPQRMVVLGMGKLGGGELNYSSDIDLIFVYPEEGKTDGKRCVENSRFFLHVGRQLIKVLANVTDEGFVFRVDIRLRPFGEAGPLAISFDAMEHYYQQHGRDWERYAMIKARVVAGDADKGQELEARLRPFIYRRYLDYGAFEALRKMKAMINAETKRRGLKNNIKLGPGGIREIEFMGQAFQLIRGGRDPELRVRSIQKVLQLLEKKDYLPSFAVAKLLDAYTFLRRTENRIQMIADQQTHTLPAEEPHRSRIAFAMGFDDWRAFEHTLNAHRRNVREQFETVFATPQVSYVEESNSSNDPMALLWSGKGTQQQAKSLLKNVGYRHPDEVYENLIKHRQGRWYQLMSAAGRERMDRLMPLLIGAGGQGSEPDVVLPRLLQLTEAVARRSVYLAFLAENPLALSQLVKLSAASAWIADYVNQHPILLDELLDARVLYAPPGRDGLKSELHRQLSFVVEDDLEGQLDRLRHFKQANVLRVAAADVMDVLPLMQVSDQLTWIAEAVLAEVINLCWRQLVTKYGRPRCSIDGHNYFPGFAIIGYGKLGGLELGYGSDLDIVFLHDSEGRNALTDGKRQIDNALFFARLGQRIIHFLTTFTPAGELYEVDARLRPSGASGLLVSSIQAFEDYQKNRAWTWEHQALVRARPVAGNKDIAGRFNAIRQEVLCQPRDTSKLQHEVYKMRKRMWEGLGHHQAEWFDIKKDPGGIADIEFMVQYNVLAHAHEYPALTNHTDNIRILENLASCQWVSDQDAKALMDIYRRYRDKVHALSLQGKDALVNIREFSGERDRVRHLWRSIIGV